MGHDHAAGALRVRAVVAADANRLLAEPAKELPAVDHLAARLGERFAHLERHQQGELLRALLQQVEGSTQDLATYSRRGGRPAVLGRDGRVEGTRAIRRGGIRDGLEHEPCGGITHVDGATRGRIDPVATDE